MRDFLSAVAAVALVATTMAAGLARADDAYISGGAKLLILDKTSSKKLVYVSRDKFDLDGDGQFAHKGAGAPDGTPQGAALGIDATLEVFYTDNPANNAVLAIPGSGFIINRDPVAKYLNSAAPTGGAVQIAVVKHNSDVAKVLARALGDTELIDILAGGPGPRGITAVLTVHNQNDNGGLGATHRMCTRFIAGTPVIRDIAGGKRLLMMQPQKTNIDFTKCITGASPSPAFLDGSTLF
jgi:hypothetical protein